MAGVMYQVSENLSLPHITHGFFGREGGVSDGIYASLNCGYGSGDDKAKVRENRLRVSHALGSEHEVTTCFQIHSNKVITLTSIDDACSDNEADALVTNVANLPIGILTADCLPVLFADVHTPIIGAAHAGWKGAIGGILEATIAAMKALGARDIVAAIGPAIAQSSYEVGAEFYARFTQESLSNAQFFFPSPRDGAFLFDLKAYAKARLIAANISSIIVLPHDTYTEEKTFFSFRRTTHRNEKIYGRQVAAIMIQP